jgi:hypothetical protein
MKMTHMKRAKKSQGIFMVMMIEFFLFYETIIIKLFKKFSCQSKTLGLLRKECENPKPIQPV